jgi:chemosensory pili system protein ChpA (sensor histidine kinase/response regulator)
VTAAATRNPRAAVTTHDETHASLTLVAAEVTAELAEARAAIETFVERPEDRDALRRFEERVHLVRGALRVVEFYGAALLAEEMEQVARYLEEHAGSGQTPADDLDALLRAMEQLPAYVDRVVSGGRDVPLALLPLLNDLRAVRGGALLSEGTLLMLNLRSDEPARPAHTGEAEPSVAEVARKLRPRFQIALLGWFRGESVEKHLAELDEIAGQIEAKATTQGLFQLWWVVGAVLEALRSNGIDGNVSVKRLLGQADRELRRLIDLGESAYATAPPVELLNNLLYYVGRSRTAGPRIGRVRNSFRLDEVLASAGPADEAGETLTAPSVRLMNTVAAAIREDLTRVKDVLDIFVRKGATQVDDLVPQLEMLRKISDTLGVLGLGELRDRVLAEIGSLEAIVARRQPADDATLLGVAAALIAVEDSLDGQLVRLILPEGSTAAAASQPADEEFRQVREAVLRECAVNMARIKDAIAHAAGAPAEAQGFDQVPQLVRGITAGLLILEEPRAVEVMERLGRILSGIALPDLGALAGPRLDHLADGIVAVEYYMEMLQSGRPDPGRMLDAAEQALAALKPLAGKVVSLRPGRAEGEPAATVPAEPEPAAAQSAPQHEPVEAGPAAAPAPAAVAPPTSGATGAAQLSAETTIEVEPEFLALFIEEARENVATLHTLFPQWRDDPVNLDALRDLRRIFHTLKGSGRMVGAHRIAELAWSVEDVLNRVLNQTVSRSPEIVGLVSDALLVLPKLVSELEQAAPPVPEHSGLVARATALTGQAVEAPAAPAPQPPEEVAEPAGMDPVLREIFRKETAGHLTVVRDFIAHCVPGAAPYHVTEALYRACHTLSGIAKTAGASQGIKVAEPMEHYIRKLHDSGHGLPEEGLSLLRDTARGLENVADHVAEDTGYFPDHGRLVAGWHVLERALDAELARLEEAAEQTVAADAASRAEPSVTVIDHSFEHFAVPETPVASERAVEPRPATDDVSEPVSEEIPIPPVEAEPEPSIEQEFDADIAAIFGEEAGELLERADATLLQWTHDRSDRSLVTELKRLLHTLKGGARMSGIRSMGDLSHHMETLLAETEAGHVASEPDAIAVLQASLDELHRMRDLAASGQRIPPATELIARARSVSAGTPTPAAAAEPEAPVVMLTEQAVVDEPVATEPSVSLPAAPEVAAAFVPDTGAPSEPEPVPEVIAAEDVEPVPASAFQPAEAPIAQAAPAEAVVVPTLPGREPAAAPERHELARVAAELLDDLLNNAGEVSIFRARIEQQMASVEFNLAELGRTVTRLREQLRKMEMETEAQILFKHQGEVQHRADFDPLELDRYSTIQQLSRALAESVSDVASLEGLLGNLNREAQNLLQQQGRVLADLQGGLMRTRMVPFQRHAQRLTRLVRQAALETGKHVDLVLEGGSGELDRQVLERMLPPFEHMLRNAVVHGIEMPQERVSRGKPETGRITVSLNRDGADVVIVVEDDGGGVNVEAVRAKARSTGLLGPEQQLADEEALQLILEPGFSTADRLTQAAGRGVGMDVVASEVKKLGGGLFIESTLGRGTRFTIRLPFTLAITQALIVRVHEEFYALPVATVEGVARLPRSEIERHLAEEHPTFEYAGQPHRFHHLASFIGGPPTVLPDTDAALPVILVRAGERSAALVTDELVGSREIVLKSVGPQLASIRGIAGATILGDGRIVVILDVGALVRSEWRGRAVETPVKPTRDERIFAMVVDDSITVRRVTQRLLERNGMRVITANDGLEALSLLQEHVPDVILLDIEMPRMDGYEVAAHVRNDPRLADVPIIMVTSRVGEKHRARAIELGVDDYLGKPYQESQLLDAVEALVLARRAQPD